MDNRFTKAERLNGKKEINSLFDNGNKMFSYPYSIFWRYVNTEQQDVPIRVLISASKRSFKKAVDRNHIKRFIKEAYRIQKNILTVPLKDKKIQLAILFIEKEVKDFHFHEKAIKKLLHKLAGEIANLSNTEQ